MSDRGSSLEIKAVLRCVALLIFPPTDGKIAYGINQHSRHHQPGKVAHVEFLFQRRASVRDGVYSDSFPGHGFGVRSDPGAETRGSELFTNG